MNRCRSRTIQLAALIAVSGAIAQLPPVGIAATENVIFTLDPTQSSFSYATTGGIYGSYVPQSPDSNVSSVSGHFVVSFDPLTDTPTNIQFIGGDGYYQQDSTIAVQSAAPGLKVTYNNLSWDFSSPVLSGTGGVFSAATTSFNVLGGTLTETSTDTSSSTVDETGYTDHVTDGTWTLTQSPAGSGAWTLGVSGHYTDPGPRGSTETFSLNAVSTAQFGASNVTTLIPTDTHADVLGGASTPGGVSINLPGTTNGGTFVAQQIPNPTGLSQQAIAAAEKNPIFAASTGDLSINPQIWSVDYTGLQAGQSATLVFHYDPSLLPVGTDESTLGLWHFDKTANAWEFGGTVNTTDHTITFVTTSFSPFDLGVRPVPEPSTFVLLGLGLLALFGCRMQRRPIA